MVSDYVLYFNLSIKKWKKLIIIVFTLDKFLVDIVTWLTVHA